MRKLTVFVMSLITMMALCACGSKEEVRLSVWCASDDVDMVTDMADEFAAKYSSKADFTFTISAEEEMNCKEDVLADIDSAADVFIFAADQFEELYRAGALLAVTTDADKIISDNGGEDAGSIRCATRDGQLYAYPLTASNGYFLYYNKEYFSDEDVKSFDRILEVAADNGKKVSMDYSSGWYIYSFFKGAGLDVSMNEDGLTNTCNWNSVTNDIKGVDVAQAMLDIASNAGFLNCGDDAFVAGVEDGTIIAGINGTWNSTKIEAAWGDNYAATKLPTYTVAGKQRQMCSFAGYKLAGVNSTTEQSEWAMQFAEWITNEDNQLKRFEIRGEGPSNVNAAANEEVLAAPAIAALGEQSEFGYLQNVAEAYWNPTYLFGVTIAAGNQDNADLQVLLDEMTQKIIGR